MTFAGRIRPDGSLTARIDTPPDMARIHLAGHTIPIPPGAIAMELTITRNDDGTAHITAEPVYEEPTQ